MFWFKLWHRMHSLRQTRKPKFASDAQEIEWLLTQGEGELGKSPRYLTSEQRQRWAELTDRPYPSTGKAIR